MSKEVKIGLFVSIILVMLYFGINYLKGINFLSPANKYYTTYNNIDQLAVSDPVLINGYMVGRVSNISILQKRNGLILVELDVDSDIILGDSTVAVLSADFLGNKSILLHVGELSNPLKRNDTLRSKVAAGIFDVFTEQAAPVANNIQTTLLKLDAVLDMLMKNSEKMDTIFMRFMHTPILINRLLVNGSQKLDEISSSLTQVSGNVSSTMKDIRPVIKNFKTFSKSLIHLEMAKTLDKTNKMLTHLTKILSKTIAQDNTIGKLLMEDSLYVNLNTVLHKLDTLATHFNNNPKHFLAPLGKTKKQIKRLKKREQ